MWVCLRERFREIKGLRKRGKGTIERKTKKEK
jgi:hypothetical protein